MSTNTDKDKTKGGQTQAGTDTGNQGDGKGKTSQIQIEVSRDAEIEQIRKDYEQRVKDLELAKTQSDSKLNTIQDQLKTAQDTLKAKEGLLSNIAHKKFEEEKRAFVDAVKKDMGDEKATEFEQMIGDDPSKLDNAKATFDVLSEYIKKGKEGDTTGDDGGNQSNLEHNNPDNPTEGHGAKIPPDLTGNTGGTGIRNRKFSSPAEMIKTIIEKASNDKDPEQLEAQKIYNQMWKKALPIIRNDIRTRGLKIQECPKCHYGMEGNKCWNCEWSRSEFEEKV